MFVVHFNMSGNDLVGLTFPEIAKAIPCLEASEETFEKLKTLKLLTWTENKHQVTCQECLEWIHA